MINKLQVQIWQLTLRHPKILKPQHRLKIMLEAQHKQSIQQIPQVPTKQTKVKILLSKVNRQNKYNKIKLIKITLLILLVKQVLLKMMNKNLKKKAKSRIKGKMINKKRKIKLIILPG